MKKIILITILSLVLNCNAFSSKKSDDKTPLLAAILLLNTSSCTSSFGTGVADFISKTFTCVTVTVTGTNGGSYAGVLNLTPIPEAETYAIFLAGLGLMGFISRRHKLGL